MTYGYALQIAAIAAVISAIAMTGLWIGSRRVDRQIARLKEQGAAEHALTHPPQS